MPAGRDRPRSCHRSGIERRPDRSADPAGRSPGGPPGHSSPTSPARHRRPGTRSFDQPGRTTARPSAVHRSDVRWWSASNTADLRRPRRTTGRLPARGRVQAMRPVRRSRSPEGRQRHDGRPPDDVADQRPRSGGDPGSRRHRRRPPWRSARVRGRRPHRRPPPWRSARVRADGGPHDGGLGDG